MASDQQCPGLFKAFSGEWLRKLGRSKPLLELNMGLGTASISHLGGGQALIGDKPCRALELLVRLVDRHLVWHNAMHEEP